MASKEFKKKVEEMEDEDEVQKLLDSTTDPDERKVIRARHRVLHLRNREPKPEGEDQVAEVDEEPQEVAVVSAAPRAQIVGTSHSSQSKQASAHESSSVSSSSKTVTKSMSMSQSSVSESISYH